MAATFATRAATFFIGISERTNETGAGQLAQVLESLGYSAGLIDIRGVGNILHLKSGLASLGGNRLVINEALSKQKGVFRYELVRKLC